jgi:hypothetical protein
MATTPTKSRASELRSLGRRIVTAADAAAPAVDSGFDVTEWDQVLLVVTGNAAGIAELMLYMQYRSALAATEGTAMYPALHIPEVALVNHTLSQTPAVYVINTMFADRIFPSVVSFSTATSVYLNVIGVTPEGGELVDSVSASSGGGGDVNVEEWGGTTVLNGGTAGSPAVGGVVAHDAAVSGAKPVIVGAKATDAEPGAVTEADAAYLSTTLAGRLRVNAVGNVDDNSAATLAPVRVAGTAYADASTVVAAGDVANLSMDLARRLRTLPQGATADDAADTAALNPMKIGAVVDQVVVAASDADMVHLITDLYRRLRVVSAAYDDVAAADRVSANTTADDRDESAQVWANETLAAVTEVYYPSSAGAEIGNRPWLTIQIGIRDGTLTFQSSNDGTTWTDVTKMVVDRGQGGGGYASWVDTADAAVVTYQLELVAGARYVRALWTPDDATSTIQLFVTARAA